MSKACTERLVADASTLTGIPTIIVRPSIVVGDPRFGGHTGYYSFFKMMWALSRNGAHAPIRIAANTLARLHLVPVEFLAKTICRILAGSELAVGVINVVPDRVPTVGEAFNAIRECLRLRDVRLLSPEDLDVKDLSPLEAKLYRALEFHAPYMRNAYTFETHNRRLFISDPPIVDEQLLARLHAVYCRYLRNDVACWSSTRTLEPVTAPSGA